MSSLTDHEAFVALQTHVADGPAQAWSAASPSIDRLRQAWRPGTDRSQLELAVLVRQVLTREASQRSNASARLFLPSGSPLDGFDLDRVGLGAAPLNGGRLVSARSWRPDWTADDTEDGLEAYASSEAWKRTDFGAVAEGDPFLGQVGHSAYQSVGQRAAVRAALTTPPGASLTVSLATGEGKSLIFQLAARLGFSDGMRGLVVVVTPTVALAIDHENAAIEKGFSGPIAYRGGQEASNALLIQAIREGRQALCIASPEAICGPLRMCLGEAADRGELSALVVDEAHLVDAWGTGFRTEFQSLSGVRRDWISRAPSHRAMRTLLLSATLTPPSLQTLRALFSGPGPFEVLSALRLRSEPDYRIVAPTTASIRDDRVVEALRHAPRPAILYVTRVVDAEAWRVRLKAEGFENIAMVHGGTPAATRESILRQWRAGDLDLVVGTSAFGVGIDYQHVRTVLHACIPETLDRYYQEVGRAGRDGRAALALMLPALGDEAVAQKLSDVIVIGVKRGLQRWKAMFDRRLDLAERDTYLLPLDIAPSQDPDDIDMQGERNSDWNARVLALMARAGLIDLLGPPISDGNRVGPHERVKVLDFEHSRSATWHDRVEAVRHDLQQAGAGDLKRIREFALSQGCPSPSLLKLYNCGPESHACARCTRCRPDPNVRVPSQPRVEPRNPWPPATSVSATLTGLLDHNRRAVVWYDPHASDRGFRRRLRGCFEALHAFRVLSFGLVGVSAIIEDTVKIVGADRVLFASRADRYTRRRLPPGPEALILGSGENLDRTILDPRSPGFERVVFMPRETLDPDRPGVYLSATYAGRQYDFNTFYSRLTI